MEQKIVAKILEIQKGTLSQDIGLFNGDMGICLALYLSRMAKDMPLSAETETHADKLLEHIISEARNAINPAFDNGLSGIGWAINFLHAHKCIEGDIDDILYNIDASIYKELTKNHVTQNICLANGLLGYLVYFTGRLENIKHKTNTIQHSLIAEAVHILTDKTYELMPKALDRISKDIYASILWEVPLIFIHLAKIHNAGVYQEKIQCMIKCWGMQIQDAIPYLNTNKLHLATSLGYTNQWFQNPHIDKHIDLLIHAIDFKEIKNEIEFRATNINEGWPFTALILYWANKYITGTSIRPFHFGSIRKSILKENRAEFIKALYLDKEKGMPLSFINGLSGIAVANAIWPEAFS